MTLPSKPRKDIYVRLSEKTIIIEKTSHFQLYYSNTQEVTVTVSDSMANKVCGACDKMLPFRDVVGFSQETMQEYMAPFSAQDFPTW